MITNTGLFALSFLFLAESRVIVKREGKLVDALNALRGGSELSRTAIADKLRNGEPGKDYPDVKEIPPGGVDCKKYAQPGFYADDSPQYRCQVFYRCTSSGRGQTFLCPTKNIFNQITLTCDWFYNVDCKNSKVFENLANSKLGLDGPLFDEEADQEEIMQLTKSVKSNRWSWDLKKWDT